MKSTADILAAQGALRSNMDFAARSRWKVRAIMDGGAPAIRALLGDELEEETTDNLPWPNVMLSGMTRLAQKIGHMPNVRVDAPRNTKSEAPKVKAEKRNRLVRAYDLEDRVELQLPQQGRWLPGYGFGVWTIGARVWDGLVYPKSELRDPFDCFPGEWGVDQQPAEMAVVRIIGKAKAKQLYPDLAQRIDGINPGRYARGHGGGVILGQSSGWSNQYATGVEYVEYYDEDGCHMLLPQLEAKVGYIPNPLTSGPAFVVPKRFAFNQLIGQYDHTIGLMAAIAKINILVEMAMTDAVMAPTNISGDLDAQYRVGRFEVNYLPQGTKVEKAISNLPYQMFEHINRIERQFRLVAGYPIQDDGQSPTSWATGQGLEELNTSVSNEVREYHKVLRFALQDLDAKRLEWDEKVSPTRRKTFVGIPQVSKGAETYKPESDIAGNYKTRREYGLMAGWDDPQKIVGGIQMMGSRVLDRETFQQNIDGLSENLTEINERIYDDEARQALMRALLFAAENGDPKAHMALIEMLPAGDLKTSLEKYYTPQGEEMSPEEAALAEPPAPEDPTATILSRLTDSGQTQGGAQTVAVA